ncbi:MAG: DUF2157 domain-containing protein [Betaproteobacteria bacterium]|nr:MAG: DUF2157 domain-containing protein [Betaproteobacteria bacterium]
MPVESRADAQRRTDEIRAFQRELQDLHRRGVLLLTDEQTRALDRYHGDLLGQFAQVFDVDTDSQAKQLSLGMRIASLIGALALGASVFFLFFQIWGLFATPVQVAILVLAALGTFVATLLIQRREGSGYFTKLAALVAFVCFVLNIAMLGRIFDVTPSDKALIPWAALALLLAYACDLRLLLVAGLLCIIAFIGSRTGTVGGMYWLYFGERPENFFPAALILFLVPQVIPHHRFGGFAATFRVMALLTLFLPMLVLANWGDLSYLPWDEHILKNTYQVLGFAASALVAWLGVQKGWVHVVNTGVVFFLIFLYTKFFDWWWEIMPKYLFFLVVGMTAVLFLMIFRRLRMRIA